MRRRPGMLLPVEAAICLALLEGGGEDGGLHGYAIARRIQSATGAKRLTAHGTLYKALTRLVDMGLLDGRWEDPAAAAEENRPRRRYYTLTARGVEVAQAGDALVPELTAAPGEAG